MHILGLVLLIAGFLGVPAVMLLNISKNLSLSLAVHVGITAILITLCVWKWGSFQAWVDCTKKGAVYNVHAAWVVLTGLLFSIAGSYLMLNPQSSDGPNAMTPREIVYFGSIFVLMGAGMAATAVSKLLRTGKRQPPVRRS